MFPNNFRKIHFQDPNKSNTSLCGIVKPRRPLFLTTIFTNVTCQFCLKHEQKEEIIQTVKENTVQNWVKHTDPHGNIYWECE